MAALRSRRRRIALRRTAVSVPSRLLLPVGAAVLRINSRRKRTYVNARVQGRIIARVAAYWVLYHVVLWHGLFVYRYAQARSGAGGELAATPFRELYAQFCIDYLPLLVCAGLILPLFMIDFVRLTHRMVGPLVRVGDALQQIMEGRRVPRVEFRKGDLLTEFESEFNQFLAFYDQQRAGGDRAANAHANGAPGAAEQPLRAATSVANPSRTSEAVAPRKAKEWEASPVS